jgi:hypothetical protein
MLRRLIISFSVAFAFQHLVADVVKLIAPGTEWGPDDSKLGIYSSAVLVALFILWQDKKEKKFSRNEGNPEQNSSGLQ